MKLRRIFAVLLCLTLCIMPLWGGAAGAQDSGGGAAIAAETTAGVEFEAGEAAIGERGKGYMEWQGIRRMFEYYIPTSYNGKRMPLMFTIPGSGHNSTMQLDEISGFQDLAEKEGFILIACNAMTWLPQNYDQWIDSSGKKVYADAFVPSVGGAAGAYYYEVDGVRGAYVNGSAGYTTNSTHPMENTVTGEKSISGWIQAVTLGTERVAGLGIDDEGYYCALVDAFVDLKLVDSKRVFASGLSQGAFMSLRLAALHADKFAGAGIVSGELTQSVISQVTDSTSARPVKLVYFHGDRDSTVPSGRSLGGGYYSRTEGPHPWGASFKTLNETIGWFLNREGIAMGDPAGVALPKKDVMVADYNSDLKYPDPTSITRYEYGGGSAVVYWTKEGGHTWPGGTQYAALSVVGQASMQADASELMWSDLMIEIIDETAAASVKKLDSGDKNELAVSITKTYDNGEQDVASQSFLIDNDAAGVYEVDDYSVYVATRSDGSVSECYIVSRDAGILIGNANGAAVATYHMENTGAAAQTYNCILAVYDFAGKMIDYGVVNVQTDAGGPKVAILEKPLPAGATARAFVWDAAYAPVFGSVATG